MSGRVLVVDDVATNRLLLRAKLSSAYYDVVVAENGALLYDPTTQSDGLALPKHSVDTFYVAAVLPEAKRRVPVPAAYFQRD